ncbi:putative quinol monooxygenase [Kandleria vitulina]|uniref:putative quinol monooxygenase n=1 Tax=Kandleria vitulina TaxID=1630 RepID=UPI001F3470B4|nr:antibiotic biosynthesis monooxygenase [Kandleria vitulina]
MKKSVTVAKIRQEKGNEKYEYYLSDKDPKHCTSIDRWINQEAIDKTMLHQ